MKVYYALYNNNEAYEDYQEWVGDFGYLDKRKCEKELKESGYVFYEVPMGSEEVHSIETWKKMIKPEKKVIRSVFGIDKIEILPPEYQTAELCVLEVQE